MTVRTRSGRLTRSRNLRSATTERARAQTGKLSALPRRKSLRTTPGRRKTATTPQLPSKRITSPCDSSAQSQETATDKRSTSPNRAISQPSLTTRASPETTQYTLQWLRKDNRMHLEGWLREQPHPQVLLDPKTPPRSTSKKMELGSFQEPDRGRKTRRALQREMSYTSTSTQWRTGIDNMSPAPSLAPKGLTRNLGMSPEQKRRMPP